MRSNVFKMIFYSPKGLRWIWSFILFLLIIAACIAIVVAPLQLILSRFGLSPQIGKPVTGWFSILGSIITLLFAYCAFLLGTHLAQRWLRNGTLSSIGLAINNTAFVDVLIGLGFGTLIVAFSTFLSSLLGWYQFVGFSWQFRPADILIPAVVMSFIASIQAPLIEEIIFRGFIFQTLFERWSFPGALLFSSFLFGLAHLTSMENTVWWAAIIGTFLAGMMFVQAYLVRKSLWIPIGIHFGWIFSGRLLNDIGQSADKALFLASNVDGPNLIVAPTGGGVGLFELIGVGIVSLILWRITRK